MKQSYTTKNGTILPLANLKGKSYMLVAHRIVWFEEETERYTTNVQFPILTDEKAMALVTVTTFDKEGKVIRSVQDAKTESKKDFADFVEKSVTGALGRCLGQLGKGTAYALTDFDEGKRIVDAPLESLEQVVGTQPPASSNIQDGPVATPVEPVKRGFRRESKLSVAPAAPAVATAPVTSTEWEN